MAHQLEEGGRGEVGCSPESIILMMFGSNNTFADTKLNMSLTNTNCTNHLGIMIIALCSISISIDAEVVALQHDTNNRELIIKCSHRYPENSVYAAVARLQVQDHLLLFPASEFQKGNLQLTRMSTNSRTCYYYNPIADQAAERRRMINFVGTAIFGGM